MSDFKRRLSKLTELKNNGSLSVTDFDRMVFNLLDEKEEVENGATKL
jgi:hypothetical protein